MKQQHCPHDSWANYYDFVYETTYGVFYKNITEQSLNIIENVLPTGKILDMGAGTGRMSIPLSKKGYNITAIERSANMYKILKQKSKQNNIDINILNLPILDYNGSENNMVLCLFTVLNYILDEDELEKTISIIKNSLVNNGYIFFDIAEKVFFNIRQLININRDYLQRKVIVNPTDVKDIYSYTEECGGIFNGQSFKYTDEFKIRYWEPVTVINKFIDAGFEIFSDYSEQFKNTGSAYFVLKKK
ncbi:class I SAM-dependent methyltransferase [Candidatus Dependentiae bacterium]|nr:class I SAM-dependent methyltransferase [Candidatus Dependentiae bacterium]